MTIITLPNSLSAGNTRRLNNGDYSLPSSDSTKARLFLLAACFWPLLIMALFASSAPRVTPGATVRAAGEIMKTEIQNVLDRVDILGYGPTHPRIAAVIVGEDKQNLVSSLESVFRNTDLNRIFVVCVVVDGHEEDAELVKKLEKIDNGEIPHWHGIRADLHLKGQKEQEEDDPHGSKVHVVFNKKKLGVARSRADAVEFILYLQKYHEDSGLKSPQEDLLLLLMKGGSQLTSRHWLAPVTSALIVPPPLLGVEDPTVSMKLANAVSFNVEGPGKRIGFDTTFTRVISEPSATDINLSSGASYPAPALSGAVVALRLDTYTNLPSQDMSLTDSWPASLDLSLNLWLCADGIDVLRDVDATDLEQSPAAPLPPVMAARFAAAWMDDVTAKRFFNAYTKTYNELTYLEWETYMAKARDVPSFTKNLPQKCRSFTWYAQEINTDMKELLTQSEQVPVSEKTEEKRDEGAEQKPNGQQQPVVNNKPQPPHPNDADKVEGAEKRDGNGDLEPPAVNEGEGEELAIPARNDKRKPSKPLCEECLTIVQQAHPVDIAYVDVSDGHKEHPHLGAYYEGSTKLGYIHNAKALHESPPLFTYDSEKLREACLKRDNNYRMLKERVVVDLKAHEEANKSGRKRAKIFCLVYTIDSGHPKIPLIMETWGSKCDGFMVGSNLTETPVQAVGIPHEGPEEYNNIWQKVRSMWSYVYDNYYNDYDWFHIGGDDLYLVVENLRLYLESEEIQTASNGGLFLPNGDETTQVPLFLGRRFAYMGNTNEIFNSGGAGYTLNKAALKILVVDGFTKYFPHLRTFSEDTMVARVLKEFGIYPYETKDANGGERYMPFLPGHHYGYRLPKDRNSDWYARYSINIKEGAEHCSPQSVAFHYVKGDMMKRLHALLYNMCPADTQ